MRIAFLNQFYAPDLAATAGILASLAERLAAMGHEVTVITSRSVADDPARTTGARNGVRVSRLWTPKFGKRRLAGRLADYACFYLQAFFALLFLRRQDVVVSLTTPPYIGLAALAHRLRSWRTRLILWNMDCYPEAAESAGLIHPGGILSRFLRAVNRLFMHRMDRIVCLDGAMEGLLQSHYGSRRRLPTVVIPNWEPRAKFPEPASRPPLDGRSLIVLYQGNGGVGHEFETILECARRMKDNAVTFRFVGGGKWWPWLEEHTGDRDLPGWEVRPFVTGDGGLPLYADADVAFISLRESCKGIMSPSKLHGCLGSGLPILYIGPSESNVDECLQRYGCGASIRNGEADDAARFLEGLIGAPERLLALSRSARSAFDESYADDAVLPRFERLLTEGNAS
jgi:glycosyltransferase involved in cell wall biosynthesis